MTRLDDSGDCAPLPDSLVPELRPLFLRLRDSFLPLALRTLRALALVLGLESKEALAELHAGMLREGNRSDIRSLFYPAIKGEENLSLCGMRLLL